MMGVGRVGGIRNRDGRVVVDWLFASRADGRIVVVQWPNVPLWAFIAAVAFRSLLHPAGLVSTITSGAATIALLVWAIIEIGWGVNPFRRGLGAVVLATELISLALSLHPG
jgi:hypothetical protein